MDPLPPHDPRHRVGRNHGRYLGDRIEPIALVDTLRASALGFGWIEDSIVPERGLPIPAFIRRSPGAVRNVYLSSGMHGDEPAGPMAVQRLIEEDQWDPRFNYWVIPCLNPGGFQRNTRENEDGIDMNRDYRSPRAPFVKAHIDWLSRQPRFDLGLLLHEDWESNGFYLYELNPDSVPSVCDSMVDAVRSVCPIESATQIDGREAAAGMIRFVGQIPEREDWPEALHLIHHKTRLNYTLESPSDFILPLRASALVTAVRTALAASSS